jgi:hypothetical protein
MTDEMTDSVFDETDDLTPEQKTRREIDKKLRLCGWQRLIFC